MLRGTLALDPHDLRTSGGLMLGRGNAFRFERRTVAVVPLRGMDQPLGKAHLAVGEPEAVFFSGHDIGAGFQVLANDVEITLGRGSGQVILRVQRSARQHAGQ